MKTIGGSTWLAPWEQDLIIEALLRSPGEVVKWDNGRSLPLKMGGTTDIYMNLRNARNDPKVNRMLAEAYENPLRRLRVTHFGEVPDAVSCFAGQLSVNLRIPYVTIREQPKEGRVSKANLVGNLRRGQRFALIDDVVTDGGSKIVPVRECLKAGVDLGPLVVLVDREQGWRKKFAAEGLDLEVWAGMTLHDVRRYLIRRGIMERCKKDVEEKNPLIVAYDGKEREELFSLADRLRTTGCIIKVNDLMFWNGYEHLVPELDVYGRVMVDFKGHDIPNTIGNTAKRFAAHPPWAVTVHASGGKEMIKAAVKAFEGKPTKVLAITVLTSIDPATCEEIYARLPLDQVKKLAEIAVLAGAHGLVCSPEEVGELKPLYPNILLVTPGIRSGGASQGDQKRVGTPKGARDAGATHLVMGRQILEAPDPVAEVHRLFKEELSIV